MNVVTLGILDHATGQLVLDAEIKLEDGSSMAEALSADVAQVLGESVTMGCANPDQPIQFEPVLPLMWETTVRVRDYWHNSFIEGPGRRSVVRLQGCPIRCQGCWVPQTHDADGGASVPIRQVVRTLLDSAYSRDGVTIVGGEPFAQPIALCELVRSMREAQPDLHILVYSGYTMARLQAMCNPYIDEVLTSINVLIDGPLVISMRHGECDCSEQVRQWTGSCNQRVRELRP